MRLAGILAANLLPIKHSFLLDLAFQLPQSIIEFPNADPRWFVAQRANCREQNFRPIRNLVGKIVRKNPKTPIFAQQAMHTLDCFDLTDRPLVASVSAFAILVENAAPQARGLQPRQVESAACACNQPSEFARGFASRWREKGGQMRAHQGIFGKRERRAVRQQLSLFGEIFVLLMHPRNARFQTWNLPAIPIFFYVPPRVIGVIALPPILNERFDFFDPVIGLGLIEFVAQRAPKFADNARMLEKRIKAGRLLGFVNLRAQMPAHAVSGALFFVSAFADSFAVRNGFG